jgi:hypothetical protein
MLAVLKRAYLQVHHFLDGSKPVHGRRGQATQVHLQDHEGQKKRTKPGVRGPQRRLRRHWIDPRDNDFQRRLVP